MCPDDELEELEIEAGIEREVCGGEEWPYKPADFEIPWDRIPR